jgi:hypothetical protein
LGRRFKKFLSFVGGSKMKVIFTCPKCSFGITPEMKHAVSTGECPGCGEKIEVNDLPSAFLLISSIQKLNLPLTSKQITDLLQEFLINRLGMKFPQIIIEDEIRDKTLRAFSELQNHGNTDNTTNNQNQKTLKTITVEEVEKIPISPSVDKYNPKPMSAKEFNKTSKMDGVEFLDPQDMQTRPILHTDVGNILPRPAGRQV